jgi:DNA-binding NarL/FixJ family response regulator
MPIFRVLVVDDYEPFRRLVRLILQLRDDLQIVGEAADGLEAVQKAKELQPDLILLDVDLPKLNGIQVASRLRDHLPLAKILFLSVESSSDVVREALIRGAVGYVNKLKAQSELLPAVKRVLAGKQFVGSGLEYDSSECTTTPPLPRHHEMLIYSEDAVLVASFTRFISTALAAGNPVIVVASKSHLDSLLQSLMAEGLDMAAATKGGTFVSLGVAETLSTFMVDDLPDPDRFMNAATDMILAAAKVAKEGHARVAACGECAPSLWAQGKTDGAVWLERLWNDLAKKYELDLLCAYPTNSFHGARHERAFKNICAEHSAVHSR